MRSAPGGAQFVPGLSLVTHRPEMTLWADRTGWASGCRWNVRSPSVAHARAARTALKKGSSARRGALSWGTVLDSGPVDPAAAT